VIYILLPAYQEAENIQALLKDIDSTSLPQSVHAVVINDGSTDNTAGEVNDFSGRIQVTLLNHEVNKGLAAALNTGIAFILSHAQEDDVMITLDADGTHHPKYMIDIINSIQQGNDIVVASRYADGGKEFGVSLIRLVLSRGARVCYKLFLPHLSVRDFSCGYRGIRISVLRQTVARWGDRLLESPGFSCTGELMLKMSLHTTSDKISEIPFELHYEDKKGESKMPAFKTILGTLNLLIQSRMWKI
jgi:dolichol-phosphate mannosyltransferase